MVTTPSADLARAVRVLRNQGMEKRYENEVVGFNTRMTDIHAAIGRVQLTKLAGWTAKRQANAAFLTEHLEGVVTPPVAAGRRARLPPVHDPRRRPRSRCLRRAARPRRASAAASTTRPRSTACRRSGSTSTCRRPSGRDRQVLSLPVYPALTDGELETIVEAVNAVAKAGS